MAEYRMENGVTFLEIENYKLMAEVDYLQK